MVTGSFIVSCSRPRSRLSRARISQLNQGRRNGTTNSFTKLSKSPAQALSICRSMLRRPSGEKRWATHHQDKLRHEIGACREARGGEAAERNAHHSCSADLLAQNPLHIVDDGVDGVAGGRCLIVAEHVDRAVSRKEARDAFRIPLNALRAGASHESLPAVENDDRVRPGAHFHVRNLVQEQACFQFSHGLHGWSESSGRRACTRPNERHCLIVETSARCLPFARWRSSAPVVRPGMWKGRNESRRTLEEWRRLAAGRKFLVAVVRTVKTSAVAKASARIALPVPNVCGDTVVRVGSA